MLQELSIRNFAIIEDLRIAFHQGLTILSGETGAGKSIIINAVNLLLGSRASATLIRTGAQSAELEALFDIPQDHQVAALMAESGYDPAEGLLVRRIIARNERHRVYINGRLATMQSLTSLTALLASISGQHAHQGLLKEEEHLYILDRFGDLLALREEYGKHYRRLLPLIQREQELLRQQKRQSEQIELTQFQLEEIQSADVAPGEDQELEKERLRLKNGEFLCQTVQQCVQELYGGDGAVVERLGLLAKALEKAGRIDDQLLSTASRVSELAYAVEDLAAILRDYRKQIDLDPRQLETVEARLDLLNKLKRKYGGTLEAVLQQKEALDSQLEQIENIEQNIAVVRSELKACHEQLCRRASELSARRRQAAQALARQVEQELVSLKMAQTRFTVDLEPLPAVGLSAAYLADNGHGLSENGADRAVFMIAPNVGEAIKPLAAIASGGELSRIVLALKAILAQTDSLETVVFDEVDAGIGGGVAEMVGQKLAALAGHHQVLCITHLPQIAKFGQHHLRIVKNVVKGRTHTTITPLDAEARVEEIARMLGGEKITATTLAHARELLAS